MITYKLSTIKTEPLNDDEGNELPETVKEETYMSISYNGNIQADGILVPQGSGAEELCKEFMLLYRTDHPEISMSEIENCEEE